MMNRVFRIAFALAVANVVALASPAAAGDEGLRLTSSDLDAVLAEDPGAPAIPDFNDARSAPRRWWPIALSAVVPGLGEVATGYKRGIPLLAIDSAIWVGVIKKQNDGQDLEAEFEAFAEKHWSEAEWVAALDRGDLEGFFSDYGLGTVPSDVPLYVPRSADEREWFENAGKWDQFAWGWREYWDDIWNAEYNPDFIGADIYLPQPGNPSTWFFADNPTMTPLRNEYIELRKSSNDAFESRDRLLSAALLTRVFSILEMVYLEGFVGRHFDSAHEQKMASAPQGSWTAKSGAAGSGIVAWRMTW